MIDLNGTPDESLAMRIVIYICMSESGHKICILCVRTHIGVCSEVLADVRYVLEKTDSARREVREAVAAATAAAAKLAQASASEERLDEGGGGGSMARMRDELLKLKALVGKAASKAAVAAALEAAAAQVVAGAA